MTPIKRMSYPSSIIPAPGEGAWLPHAGLEEQCLPHTHVRAKTHILLNKSHPVSKPGWLDTCII